MQSTLSTAAGSQPAPINDPSTVGVDGQMVRIHPSRLSPIAPSCGDCAHMLVVGHQTDMFAQRCNHPAEPVNPHHVPQTRCEYVRSRENHACGLHGLRFSPQLKAEDLSQPG